MPGLGQDLQDFTRETGIQVKRLPRPNGSLNQLALWRELLQKGAAGPDVVSIDVVWSGILDLCLANCYEGRYYRQIAPRKAGASPFLNGLGDSETIGAAKRTATKSTHTA